MLLAITVLEISSGQTDIRTNKQTVSTKNSTFPDFIGGGKKIHSYLYSFQYMHAYVYASVNVRSSAILGTVGR